MSAEPPVVPANLFIADVIEATGEVFELPPLLRPSSRGGVWCSCTFCDWDGHEDEAQEDLSVGRCGLLCPECFSLLERE